jgi:hypothetical protein
VVEVVEAGEPWHGPELVKYRPRLGEQGRGLKGKSEPLHLWRADPVTAGRGGALRAAGLEPPDEPESLDGPALTGDGESP